MVPKDAKDAILESSFSQVFVPYWAFDAGATADWKAEVGHTYTTTDAEGNTTTRTSWKWESGTENRQFDNVLISGSEHLDKRILTRLDNFSLEGLVSYESDFLAGIPAQAYEVGLEDAWNSGRAKIREDMKTICKKAPSKSKIRNFSMEMNLSGEEWKYLLLPFILSSYTYEGKSYQIMVNGQKGDIAGFRPVDRKKLTWSSILAFVPGILLLLIGFVAKLPEEALLGGLIGVVIGGLLAFSFHQTARKLEG